MILSLLLLVQAVPAAAPAGDVVVMARRLERDFKAGVRFEKGSARCKIAKSTGDAEIDRIGCTAMTTCFPQFESRFDATRDRAIRPEVKKIMQSALNHELAGCFARERNAGIAALVAKRRAGNGR